MNILSILHKNTTHYCIECIRRCVFCVVIAAAIAGIAAAESVTFETVCTSLAKHPNTVGNFAQEKTINNGARSRTLKSSGTFVFSLDGIAWNTVKPFPSSLAVGMTSVIQTTPDGKQTVIDASSNQVFTSISTTLVSLYSGDADKLSHSFNIEFNTEGNRWDATLTPKDKTVAQVMTQLHLAGMIEAGSAVFDEIMLTESGGDTIKYMFSNMAYPKELSSDDKARFIAK